MTSLPSRAELERIPAALEGELLPALATGEPSYADPAVHLAIADVLHARAGHGKTPVKRCSCSTEAMALAEAATAARMRQWGAAVLVTQEFCACGHEFEGHGDDSRLLCCTPFCRCPGYVVAETWRTQTRTLVDRHTADQGAP